MRGTTLEQRLRMKKYALAHPEKFIISKEEQFISDRKLTGKFCAGKDTAKQCDRIWLISFEQYIELVGRGCFYCGENLFGTSGSSLDRIDNSKGYTIDNVLPCCGECNRIRSNKYSVKQMQTIGNLLKKIKEV